MYKKKKQSEKTDKKSFNLLPLSLAGLVIILAAIIFVLPAIGNTENSVSVGEDTNIVSIPLDDVSDGRAHYYSFDSTTGREIKYFVLQSSDGEYRAAFDACDVCYRSKKGYRQEGDYMVCNNCGQKFQSNRINLEKGGCNPAPLNREVKDNMLLIKADDIETGAFYF